MAVKTPVPVVQVTYLKESAGIEKDAVKYMPVPLAIAMEEKGLVSRSTEALKSTEKEQGKKEEKHAHTTKEEKSKVKTKVKK